MIEVNTTLKFEDKEENKKTVIAKNYGEEITIKKYSLEKQ